MVLQEYEVYAIHQFWMVSLISHEAALHFKALRHWLKMLQR